MSGFSSGEPQIFAEVGRRWANPNADADAGALALKGIYVARNERVGQSRAKTNVSQQLIPVLLLAG